MDQRMWRGPWAARAIGLALIVAVILTGAMASPAAAQGLGRQVVVVIGDDRGGLLRDRAIRVAALRQAGTRVEIRGRICYSACTMYLGAGDICIDPETIFGFHGPSRNGRALTAREFEDWSAVMARHYPAPLRDWYMATARHNLWQVTEIRGRDLLRYGYEAC